MSKMMPHWRIWRALDQAGQLSTFFKKWNFVLPAI